MRTVTKKRTVASLLAALVLAGALVCSFAANAMAKGEGELQSGPSTIYALKVNGGEWLTDQSLTGSLGDGTYAFDPSTNTLTLTNATMECENEDAIHSELDSLTVVLKGENSLSGSGYVCGIYSSHGDVTIKGEGTLDISFAEGAAIGFDGGSLFIDSTGITAMGGAYCIGTFEGDISIISSIVSLESQLRSMECIFCDSISISESTLSAAAQYQGISAREVSIDSSDVTIDAEGYFGIDTNALDVKNGSTVAVSANFSEAYGITLSLVDGSGDTGTLMNVSDSTLSAQGPQGAIVAFRSGEGYIPADGYFSVSEGLFVYAGNSLENLKRADQIGSAKAVLISAEKSTAFQVAGASRYDTAAQIALRAYPDGCPAAIIATGANFPDALGASALAGLLDIPILLTEPNRLSPAAADAIDELGAMEFAIIGGEGAVSKSIEEELVDAGAYVIRLSGADRYETCEAIFEWGATNEHSWGDTVIIATGTNYPDTLSISGCAFAHAYPIVICDPKKGLTDNAKSLIQEAEFEHAIIVGGTGVVPKTMEKTLGDLGISDVTRLAGADRYATSTVIARYVIENGGTADGACIATGANFPDALAGSALVGTNNSILLLAEPKNTSAFQVLTENQEDIYTIFFLGGDGVVTPAMQKAAKKAAGL